MSGLGTVKVISPSESMLIQTLALTVAFAELPFRAGLEGASTQRKPSTNAAPAPAATVTNDRRESWLALIVVPPSKRQEPPAGFVGKCRSGTDWSYRRRCRLRWDVACY